MLELIKYFGETNNWKGRMGIIFHTERPKTA